MLCKLLSHGTKRSTFWMLAMIDRKTWTPLLRHDENYTLQHNIQIYLHIQHILQWVLFHVQVVFSNLKISTLNKLNT